MKGIVKNDENFKWIKKKFKDFGYKKVLCLSDTSIVRRAPNIRQFSIARNLEVMLRKEPRLGNQKHHEIQIRQAGLIEPKNIKDEHMSYHLPSPHHIPRREYVTIDNTKDSSFNQHYNEYDLVLGAKLLCFCDGRKITSCGGLHKNPKPLYFFLVNVAGCLNPSNPYSMAILSGGAAWKTKDEDEFPCPSSHKSGKRVLKQAVERFNQNNDVLCCQYDDLPFQENNRFRYIYYDSPDKVVSAKFIVTIFNRNFIKPTIGIEWKH